MGGADGPSSGCSRRRRRYGSMNIMRRGLEASEEAGLIADLANRVSAAMDPDWARRRRTIRQQGAPPDWRGCMVSASG
jgi:hypothetical protein